MVFAARELAEVASALQGLPEVVISALDAGDAAALLSSVATSRLSPDVASRLVADGGGNPLALVELAAELTPAQLAGSASYPTRCRPPGRCSRCSAVAYAGSRWTPGCCSPSPPPSPPPLPELACCCVTSIITTRRISGRNVASRDAPEDRRRPARRDTGESSRNCHPQVRRSGVQAQS